MLRHTALMSVLARLASFRGRVGRGDFWAVFLVTVTVSVVLAVHPAAVTSSAAIQVKRFLLAIITLQVIAPIVLASFTFRRLYDLDKPGWWAIPFLGALLSLALIWTQTGQSTLRSLAGTGALEPVTYLLTAISVGVVVTRSLSFVFERLTRSQQAWPGTRRFRFAVLATRPGHLTRELTLLGRAYDVTRDARGRLPDWSVEALEVFDVSSRRLPPPPIYHPFEE